MVKQNMLVAGIGIGMMLSSFFIGKLDLLIFFLGVIIFFSSFIVHKLKRIKKERKR